MLGIRNKTSIILIDSNKGDNRQWTYKDPVQVEVLKLY